MFDIGFAELLIIAVVSLLVIGPERLPETVRTVSAWLARLRRGYNDIKREVQQELHNDEVMQELRRAGEDLKAGTDSLSRDLEQTRTSLSSALVADDLAGTDGLGHDLAHTGDSRSPAPVSGDPVPTTTAQPGPRPDAPGSSAPTGDFRGSNPRPGESGSAGHSPRPDTPDGEADGAAPRGSSERPSEES